jgi:putative aldouronate transport system permease protein
MDNKTETSPIVAGSAGSIGPRVAGSGGSPRLSAHLSRDRQLYLMFLPVAVWLLMFRYIPMYGIQIAFKDFRIGDGIAGSRWVGFHHFIRMFGSQEFYLIVRNTLLLNLYQLAFQFPAPIILALMLNEVRSLWFKKTAQTLLYVPHFISWVVLGGILINLLSPSSGVVNSILMKLLGMEPIHFLIKEPWWIFWFIVSGIWKTAGWGTIIYLAAISGIDPQLYEAATLDGAGKFKQIRHITLPCISGTIGILLILNLGTFMDIGFEQILMLQNNVVRSVADVIPTYVYRMGLQGGFYSYTSGIGFFQSVVGLVLIWAANRIVKALGGSGLW